MNVVDIFLGSVQRHLNEGQRPQSVTSEFGQHGVHYGKDETGTYAVIGFSTIKNVYAETEDGTYGVLQGWRVYYDE